MNVLKANRRELGRVNRESCGISIEFIHAGQSYHRLGQSLWHLIPNTFPMVAVYWFRKSKANRLAHMRYASLPQK